MKPLRKKIRAKDFAITQRTPLAAITVAACSLEEQGESGALLRLDCGDPEGTPGAATEITLWLDPADYALVRGEIRVDGFRVIDCRCSGFTFTNEEQEGSQ